jgi:hypothetical protein
MADCGHQSDFKPLTAMACLISADRDFSIKIGSVANLKIKKP